MFDIDTFSNTLQKIANTYESITEFAEKSGVNRTYISKYINKKLTTPPTPKILAKIVQSSHGIATYIQLMVVCGYYQEPSKEIEKYIYNVFNEISNYSNDYSIIKTLLNSFIHYQNDLIDSFQYEDKKRVLKISHYIESSKISMPYFMVLHDLLVKYLEKSNIIYIDNPNLLIDWHNSIEVSNYINNFSSPILFSYNSKFFKLNKNIDNIQLIEIIKQYGISLNYLSSTYYSSADIYNYSTEYNRNYKN